MTSPERHTAVVPGARDGVGERVSDSGGAAAAGAADTIAARGPSADAEEQVKRQQKRRAGVALVVVLAVSLGVRLWGLDWQLPWQFHPDEGHYTWKALDMVAEGDLNPRYFRNPTFFTYILYGQYRLLGFQAPKADEEAAASSSLLRPPSGVAFIGRLNSALMGWATVGVVAWMGWRLLGPWTGVVAAAFLGLSFLHVRDSHYATNDVPATFFLMLSVAASLVLLRRPTLIAYVAAGFLGGLATSTKYSAGLFFVPLVLATLLSPVSPRRAVGLLVAALVAGAVAYLAGTPYTLLTFDKFWADFRTQMRLGAEGWEGQAPSPSGLLYAQTLAQGIGGLALVLAVVGLAVLARRQPRAALVIAGFPIAYLLFMLRNELFFARFALPLVPFLCLLAACGVALVSQAPYRLALLLGGGLALAALLQPTSNLVLHNMLVGQEDTRVLAARWAIENIPPDNKVAIEEYTLRDRRPRAYGGPSWQLDTDLFNVNAVQATDPASALRGRYRYVVVSSFQYERFGGDAPRLARQTAFYEALERDGRLLAAFGPGYEGSPLPFELEDLYTPYWRLEQYERPGPTIKIYGVDLGL